MLTAATVRWAYRFLLGREPETPAVIDNWRRTPDISELREGILASQELADLARAGFPEAGEWIHGKVTEEAVETLLALRDGRAPDAAAIGLFCRQHADLRAMRRALLISPSIEERLPPAERADTRPLLLPGGEVTLRGHQRDPEFAEAPGLAPRYAAFLRAAWPDGGPGRVIVDSGAGIGVATLGFAVGAPRHARLLAHEPSRRKARNLAENLVLNGLPAATARDFAMGDLQPMMEREALDRLDLLRLAEPGALRLALDSAAFLQQRGTLTILSFDLTELLLQAGPSPRELLNACCASFAHVVAFSARGEPMPLLDQVATDAAMRRALMRSDRRDEFLLCPDLDWLHRFSLP